MQLLHLLAKRLIVKFAQVGNQLFGREEGRTAQVKDGLYSGLFGARNRD